MYARPRRRSRASRPAREIAPLCGRYLLVSRLGLLTNQRLRLKQDLLSIRGQDLPVTVLALSLPAADDELAYSTADHFRSIHAALATASPTGTLRHAIDGGQTGLINRNRNSLHI